MPDPPGVRIQVARKNFLEWRRENSVLTGMAAFRDLAWTKPALTNLNAFPPALCLCQPPSKC
jgi:hypothetical protein